METVSLVFFILIILFTAIKLVKKKPVVPVAAPVGIEEVLSDQVPFYSQL